MALGDVDPPVLPVDTESRKSRSKTGYYGKPKVEKCKIMQKNWLHLKLKKLESYNTTFPLVNICVYRGHKNKQKDKNSMYAPY